MAYNPGRRKAPAQAGVPQDKAPAAIDIGDGFTLNALQSGAGLFVGHVMSGDKPRTAAIVRLAEGRLQWVSIPKAARFKAAAEAAILEYAG